jgi:hypothetical protein
MSTGFDQSQSFDAFAMDDVDPDRPGSGGGGHKLPEGGYLVMITEVIVQNDRGSTQIELEVLGAKDASMVARNHTEYMPWPDAEHSPEYNRIKKEQLLAWCYATKATSPEEVKQRQQARQGFNPAWLEAMVGRQVLVFVKEGSYQDDTGNDKTSNKIEGRVWALDNPKGKGIPGWVDTSTNATPATTAPAPSVNAELAHAPEAAADPFGGLV